MYNKTSAKVVRRWWWWVLWELDLVSRKFLYKFSTLLKKNLWESYLVRIGCCFKCNLYQNCGELHLFEHLFEKSVIGFIGWMMVAGKLGVVKNNLLGWLRTNDWLYTNNPSKISKGGRWKLIVRERARTSICYVIKIWVWKTLMDFTMYWAALVVDHVRRNHSPCRLLLEVCSHVDMQW